MYRINTAGSWGVIGRQDAWPSVGMVIVTLCPRKECVGLL